MTDALHANVAVGPALRDLVYLGGREIMRIRDSSAVAAQAKPDGSKVTNADLAANDVIVAGLRRRFPQVPIVSEESPIPEVAPGESYFLIDPMDGTNSFLAGRDTFTVNVALICDGVPVLGAVSAPALDLCCWTASARSAWRESGPEPGRSCNLLDSGSSSKLAETTALISAACHYDPTREWLEARGIRRAEPLNSSVKFCMLANGEANVYPRFSPLRDWDMAAGHAVLQAAGGRVLEADGGVPLRYCSPGCKMPAFIACAREYDPFS